MVVHIVVLKSVTIFYSKRACRLFVALFILTLFTAVVLAAEANDITGIWTNEDRDGRIRIYQCGKEYCGDIVWTKDGPEVDVNNPNPGLRNRRIIGLIIMHGFHYAGDSEWKGGELYDPKTGHTYRGNLRLTAPDSLELRGYVLVPLFGRTTSWTRFEPK